MNSYRPHPNLKTRQDNLCWFPFLPDRSASLVLFACHLIPSRFRTLGGRPCVLPFQNPPQVGTWPITFALQMIRKLYTFIVHSLFSQGILGAFYWRSSDKFWEFVSFPVLHCPWRSQAHSWSSEASVYKVTLDLFFWVTFGTKLSVPS